MGGEETSVTEPNATELAGTDKATVVADPTEVAPEQAAPAHPADMERPAGTEQVAQPDAGGPAAGDLIDNRYRLERLLGAGGMGQVFLATDQFYEEEFKDRRSKVAIKFLGADFARHPSARIAIQREASRAQSLSHKNLANVHHFAQHEDQLFMTMEFMEGQSLDEFMRDYAPGGMKLDRALPMLEGMAEGLEYLHGEGLVHCDFKPENVFVLREEKVKILDLGIARVNEANTTGQKTEFDAGTLGAMTPPYASCEMFEGVEPTPADDVYALACVAYELLTGRHPFGGETALRARREGMKPQKVPGLNQRQWQALNKGLAFNRHQRTASAEAFFEGLRDDRAKRRLLIGALSTAAALGVLAIGRWIQIETAPVDPDMEFMLSLKPAADAASADPQRIALWQEQGDTYRQYAADEFDAGRLAAAQHLLSGGADNAHAAYLNITRRVDSEEAREGIMAIVEAYTDWAQSLAGDYPQAALWTVCHGLAIHPRHEQLRALSVELQSQLAQRPAAPTDCAQLVRLPLPTSGLEGRPAPG